MPGVRGGVAPGVTTALPPRTRIPRVVAVLSACVFALGTSEFMIAGLLPEIASDLAVTIPQAGYLISAFAVGMIVGAPAMAVLTLHLPRRTTLVVALVVVAVGQVAGALAQGYAVMLVARIVTAVAMGAILRRRRKSRAGVAVIEAAGLIGELKLAPGPSSGPSSR